MARKSSRTSKNASSYTHLTIEIDEFQAAATTGVNYAAYEPQTAWRSSNDEPIYRFTNRLNIFGKVAYPDGRAGEAFSITMIGDDSPAFNHDGKLEDIAVRDEYGAPRYRKYRGRDVPVYEPPSGLGRIEKVRGEAAWNTWLFLKPSFVRECTALLHGNAQMFIALHEVKEGRSRWVRSVCLQTDDPTE